MRRVTHTPVLQDKHIALLVRVPQILGRRVDGVAAAGVTRQVLGRDVAEVVVRDARGFGARTAEGREAAAPAPAEGGPAGHAVEGGEEDYEKAEEGGPVGVVDDVEDVRI